MTFIIQRFSYHPRRTPFMNAIPAPEGTLTARYAELGSGLIPVEPYISPEYYEREKAHIFKKTWLQVGRVEEIPEAGDYFVRKLDACDTEIIVVRNKRGELRAMHNVCSHRL